MESAQGISVTSALLGQALCPSQGYESLEILIPELYLAVLG